jgi:hypothetical protein
MDWNEIPHDPCHLGVPSGASKMISEPVVRSAQTVHLSCVRISTISKRTESCFHLSLITEEYHRVRPKTISEPTVCLAQTVHLSCTSTNTISKGTKIRFHMTHVTLEYHRVCPKRFLSLMYVQHKPCTYHTLRLALSPNRLNRASTWDLSPRSSIGCVQNDF